jgi:hypothetical protein
MRLHIVLLGVFAGLLAVPATASAAKCPAPDVGFHSCMRGSFAVDEDGNARVLKAVVKLSMRQDCSEDIPKRRVTLLLDGVAKVKRSAKDSGTCKSGVARWKVKLIEPEGRPWGLRAGDELQADWSKLSDTEASRAKVTVPDASIED